MNKENELKELSELNDYIFYNKISPLISKRFWLESRLWYKLNYHPEQLMSGIPNYEEQKRLDNLIKPILKMIEDDFGVRLFK